MMRSMVRSMMRPVSQWSRPGRSVASVSRLRGDRGPLVSHVGNEAALVVGSVGNNLNPAVRESHSVLSSHHSVLVLDFFLRKVSPGVRVLNSVLVSERSGGNLGRGVSRSVVKRSSVRSMVRTVVRTMGWTYG